MHAKDTKVIISATSAFCKQFNGQKAKATSTVGKSGNTQAYLLDSGGWLYLTDEEVTIVG